MENESLNIFICTLHYRHYRHFESVESVESTNKNPTCEYLY